MFQIQDSFSGVNFVNSMCM